jgi:small subunit ribosomal protein S16
MGSQQDAFYRVVVSDSRSTPRSRVVDTVGYYDPEADPPTIRLDADRIQRWVRQGARPSGTVRSLMSRASPSRR